MKPLEEVIENKIVEIIKKRNDDTLISIIKKQPQEYVKLIHKMTLESLRLIQEYYIECGFDGAYIHKFIYDELMKED